MNASAGGERAASEIEAYFRGALRVETHDARALAANLAVPADLQGPRNVTHGGAVATFLVELARLHNAHTHAPDVVSAPFVVDATFERELRVETDVIGRAVAADDGETACRIERPDGTSIASARVGAARDADLDALAERARPTRADELLARAASDETAPRDPAPSNAAFAPPRDAGEVPGTAMCLACGNSNPRGLRFRFHLDDACVWRRVALPRHFRAPAGAAFHGAAAIVLDEIGWWLGALAFGGCGVSTRLRLVCDPNALADTPLLVAGDRRDAAPADAKSRFWTSRARVVGASGRTAAVATVLFAGSHAYTRAMLADLAGASSQRAITRVFGAFRTVARPETAAGTEDTTRRG